MVIKKMGGKKLVIKRRVKVSKAVKSYVKKAMVAKAEHKFIDQTYSVTPSWAGAITQIVQPAQGSNEQQRIGDKIKPLSLSVKSYLTGTNNHIFRLILFQWFPDQTVYAPATGNILVGGYSGTLYFPLSPLNKDYKKQYHILHDKIYECDSAHPIKLINFTVPAKKMRTVNFVAGSATECIGSLHWMVVQDGVTSLNTYNANFRYTYEDA
jgi:hypothetical protein